MQKIFRQTSVTIAILIMVGGCDWLKSGRLAKSSSETDDFKCEITSLENIGGTYKYELQCVAKKQPVQLSALKSAVAVSKYVKSDTRRHRVHKTLGEAPVSEGTVLIEPGKPVTLKGKLRLVAHSFTGRKRFMITGVVSYPKDPMAADLEKLQQDQINNAWKYNLLVSKTL